MLNLLHKKIAGLGSDTAEPSARFLKLIVAQAADQHATKIVLGEPCDAQCRRVPKQYDFTPACPPWEDEDKARITGRSEQDLAEERKALGEEYRREISERRFIPLWFKIGDTYEESSAFPAFMIFELLAVIKSWDRRRISWGVEKPDWDKVADLPSQPPDKDALSSLLSNSPTPLLGDGALSSFLLRLEDGRIIQAALGFEPSFCLSISVRDTGRRI